MKFNAMFKPESEGGFTVLIPSLPGCITYGKNLQEAKEMAREAVKAYLISVKKRGENMPIDDADSFMSLVEATSANV